MLFGGGKTSFDNDTYIVNTDVEAGTYSNSGSEHCYYARLSNFSGDVLSSDVANDNAGVPTVVTVAPTDTDFTSKRCGTGIKIK